MTAVQARCCIAGGGPAGMMLGFLLARAGVEVVVLEKHADFLRDFRGDTIHPSTLEIMAELGVLEEFLRLPHQKAAKLSVRVGNTTIPFADFSHLPTRCKFVALMPQWDFLDFLADQGRSCPGFSLRMETAATALVEEGGRVVGICAKTPQEEIEIRADLVVVADGRRSILREAAGLKARDLGAPMDVLWFSLSRRRDDPDETMGSFDAGRICVLINRGDYWQCGYIIAKGSLPKLKAGGIEAFRHDLARLAPFLADRTGEVTDWDQLKLLTVGVDRLARWHKPGLLCIGDAAHTMSPIGGVGINLAIQDAVAAANILAGPLLRGTADERVLHQVQRRRELPVRIVQRLQVLAQDRVIGPLLSSQGSLSPPLLLRLFGKIPMLRRIPARLVGMGFRPEHVRTPAAAGRQPH